MRVLGVLGALPADVDVSVGSVLPEARSPKFGDDLNRAYWKLSQLCPDAAPERRWNSSTSTSPNAHSPYACLAASERLIGARSEHPSTAEHHSSLVVRRGEVSVFDELWPLADFRPLATLCDGVRYVFVMHEPIARLVSQLLKRCPADARGNHSCDEWGLSKLNMIYSHDLVLDGDDESGFMGTR